MFKLYPYFLVFALLQIAACNNINKNNPPKNVNNFPPGAVMSIESGENSYLLVKVLASDDSLVHVRIYKGDYKVRPGSVTDKDLDIGTVHDISGTGIGHIPLARDEFELMNPKLIVQQQLKSEELEGYNMWKEEYND